MKAIQISQFGGPEVLELVDLPEPQPADGQVVVEVGRAGINFADTHQREDAYLAKAELPLIPGGEIAGRTTDGRRVAALLMNGGYAQQVAVPEPSLVPIPDAVSDDQAAGLLLQGLTARATLGHCGKLQPGESVVIHAAAGGTGSLAIQLAKRMGAGRIIALASSQEKRDFCLGLGADATVDSSDLENMQDAILAANEGRQVDVVLEMAGGEAFEASLRSLAPFGRLVTYGRASHGQNVVDTGHLMRHSRAVIGFWLVHLFTRPDLLREGIEDLLGAVAAGELRVVVGHVYGLSEVAQAHEDMQQRRTHGKLLIDPAR